MRKARSQAELVRHSPGVIGLCGSYSRIKGSNRNFGTILHLRSQICC
jgi:hypothetical protein